MFERFTDKARNGMALARTRAADRGDTEIRPVHLLYGLAAADGVAARVLADLGVDAAAMERELARTGPGRPGPGTGADGGDAEALAAIGIDLDEVRRTVEETFGPGALERVPLTPKGPVPRAGRLRLDDLAKLALALSVKEARAMGHNYVGTEHLLLGLLRLTERDNGSGSVSATFRKNRNCTHI